MKKLIIVGAILFVTSAVYSQSTTKWAINGNSVNSGEFIGTTNNEPFILKSNSIVGLKIKTDGSLIIKSLDLGNSTPNGLVTTNGQGEVSRLNFNGNINNVLLGNGTWGTLPTTNNLWQVGNGSKIYYTAGKVGIGTSSPNFDLDVTGNARITNTLIVNGQLIISDKIQTSRQLKSMRVESDSIMMDSTRALYGKTIVKGDLQAKYNLGVDGNISSNGSILAKQGLTFDGINGVTQIINSNSQILRFGNRTAAPAATSCSSPPTSPFTTMQFGGNLQIFDPATTTTGGTVMNLQTWTGGSSIDASAAGNTGPTNLLLNYFCGNDVAICTGQYGGKVSMGKRVEIGMPVTDNSVALNIKANTNTQYNALQIMNESNVVNFRVKSSGLVYAREIIVQLNPFPDYVFNKDYKLQPLQEVEKYIQKHKHLSGFEKGEDYEKNGMPVAEVVRLQQEKIEELTLYLIELDKKIKELEKK